jgi:hypothetical protein
MKRILALILVSVALLLAISSCTMVRKGELRLLNMEIYDPERLRTNVQFWIRVNFEADGQPEIRRADCQSPIPKATVPPSQGHRTAHYLARPSQRFCLPKSYLRLYSKDLGKVSQIAEL